MEDVKNIEDYIKFLTDYFASPQTLYALQNQIANTIGLLEQEQPSGWEEDYCILSEFLVTLSEVIHCTS